MALQAAFRTGSIFEACDDLLQNAVPGPGLCLGLSNVVFVREASV